MGSNQDYRYKTLAELKAAFDKHELDVQDFLVIDNDSTAVWVSDEHGNYHASAKVFEGGTPTRLLREALTLLGIPWDNA
jgi:hypothetical protein